MHYFNRNIILFCTLQYAKKVLLNSQCLVDFAVGLVNSVLNLSNGQVKCFGGIQITDKLQSMLILKLFCRLAEMTFSQVHASYTVQLAQMASCKTDCFPCHTCTCKWSIITMLTWIFFSFLFSFFFVVQHRCKIQKSNDTAAC